MSKFGSLAEVCADNPGAFLGTDEACALGALEFADLATVERTLADLGYVSVPEELLESDYEGPSELGRIAAQPTWGARSGESLARRAPSADSCAPSEEQALRAAVAIIRLRAISLGNALYGTAIVAAYMDVAGESMGPPYGALIELARNTDGGYADRYDAADRIRSCRIWPPDRGDGGARRV
ncbi:hypothetical protein ACFU9Y_10585 [Streptomyces sp. NPDC057621]|uniref:hypothetical protein n=1 Tax=Streptomyces sp. NPDC057621 TaxID=3346186 RepID=UPI0036CF52B9